MDVKLASFFFEMLIQQLFEMLSDDFFAYLHR